MMFFYVFKILLYYLNIENKEINHIFYFLIEEKN